MTVQERLQLLNFGYTKEQVDAMDKPAVAQPIAQPVQTQAPTVAQPIAQPVQTQAPTVAQPIAQPVQTQAPASDFFTTLTALGAMLNAQNTQPTAQPVQQPTAQPLAPAPTQQPAQPVAPAPVQLSSKQLAELIQGVAVQTASGTIETPPTAEQALLNMFSSVAGEVNKNEQN